MSLTSASKYSNIFQSLRYGRYIVPGLRILCHSYNDIQTGIIWDVRDLVTHEKSGKSLVTGCKAFGVQG